MKKIAFKSNVIRHKISKSLVFTAAFFSTVLSSYNVASASNSDVATSDASATVIVPITISAVNPQLRFGTLVPTGTDGTVTIDPSVASRSTVDVDTISGAPFGAAVFRVDGEPGRSVDIDLPTSISLSNGTETMNTDLFTSFTTPPGTTSNTPVLLGGLVIVNVGATLHVGANQEPGDYSEGFNVTVSYQ